MKNIGNHTIRQQFLDVTFNGVENEASMIQNKVIGLCHNQLIPAIEEAFDRCSPPDDYLLIEHLEIDGGTFTMDHLEQDLAEAVIKAIEKAILELSPSLDAPIGSVSANAHYKSTARSINDAFFYFLKSGELPWSFKLPDNSTLEQVILHSWQETGNPVSINPVFQEELIRVLDSADSRKRLTLQFSTAFMKVVLSLLSKEGEYAMNRILEKLSDSKLTPFEFKFFQRQLWETIFATLVTNTTIVEKKIVSDCLKVLPAFIVKSTALVNFVEQHWPSLSPEIIEPSSTLGKEYSIHGPKSKLPEVSQHLPLIKNKQALQNQPIESVESRYINNAGLVLLHPFLPQFFQALGIVENDSLIQPERALCLLHYLSTGETNAPEFELILPKILCNIPLETPVASDIEFTEIELDEANMLLEAVIRHWEALRNTSPDSLRGTFLTRAGKLSVRDDGDWLLLIESKTYDVLLEHLPWGISMIKLPWMKQMLWVEWS